MSAPSPSTFHPTAAAHVPRVRPNARHALGGIWRLNARRFFTPSYWLILLGMLVALTVFSIPAAPTKSAAEAGYLLWVAGFYICFLTPIMAFIGSAGAMRDDLGAGTVDYVFTRPVRRPTYVVFRYLAQMACTQIDFLFAFAVILGIGMFWGVPDLWAAAPTLFLAQVAAIIVFSAFGLLCGALTSRYIIVGLVYGGVIEVGVGNVPTQLSQVSIIRHLLALMRPVVGDSGWALAKVTTAEPWGAPAILALLLAVATVLIAITAVIFSVREFAGSAGRDA